MSLKVKIKFEKPFCGVLMLFYLSGRVQSLRRLAISFRVPLSNSRRHPKYLHLFLLFLAVLQLINCRVKRQRKPIRTSKNTTISHDDLFKIYNKAFLDLPDSLWAAHNFPKRKFSKLLFSLMCKMSKKLHCVKLGAKIFSQDYLFFCSFLCWSCRTQPDKFDCVVHGPTLC